MKNGWTSKIQSPWRKMFNRKARRHAETQACRALVERERGEIGMNDWWMDVKGRKWWMGSLDGMDGGSDDPWTGCGSGRWGLRLYMDMAGFSGECYLCVREGATQGRGAGGGKAHSPPLLLQRPGQLFKLHLLLPDRLQQSCCALTLLHTHYMAPWGERGALQTSIQAQNSAASRGGVEQKQTLWIKFSKIQRMPDFCEWS